MTLEDFFGNYNGFNRRKKTLDDLLNELLNGSDFDFPVNKNNANIEFGEDKHGKWEKKTWTSEDGSTHVTSFSRVFNGNGNNLNTPKSSNIKSILEKNLDKAVKEENYEEAAKLRDALKALKNKKK